MGNQPTSDIKKERKKESRRTISLFTTSPSRNKTTIDSNVSKPINAKNILSILF